MSAQIFKGYRLDKEDRKLAPSRRVSGCASARTTAQKKLPKLIFDFIDGAAGRETGLKNNQAAFDRLKLKPRVLSKATQQSLATEFLGQSYNLPFGIAPMGMCNLSHPRADYLMAQAAQRLKFPVALSSAGSSSIEDMRKWAGDNAWFQLYVTPPMDHSLSLVQRAQDAGYRNLILTVDVPKVSRRLRDIKNGFQMPFKLRTRQFIDFSTHPVWSLRLLAAGTPKPVNFPQNGLGFNRDASRAMADWDFLARLRNQWQGNLIVKGVTAPEDALRIKSMGADAVYVSNHGGRQLDSVPASIDLIRPIREAVGREYPVAFDSGVRDAEDILKALARGADFVMLGRPNLFALAADGAAGLESLYAALRYDLSVAMAQIGVETIGQIGPHNLIEETQMMTAHTDAAASAKAKGKKP